MLCKKCGKENLDDALYCATCGARIEVENTCPSCGKVIQEDSVYCNYCGAKVDGNSDSSLNDESIKDKNTCPSCGNEVQDDAIYCNYCGARLDGKNLCASCGELFEGNFCPKCGTRTVSTNNNVVDVEPKKEKRKEKLNGIFDKTATSLLLFGVVFALIFVFLIGFSVTCNTNFTGSINLEELLNEYDLKTKLNMYYYFGDVYKDVNDAVESGGLKNLEVDYTSPVLYLNAILGTVVTAGVLVAVFVLSVLAIIKLINKLCGKDTKHAEKLAFATMLTYILGAVLLLALNFMSVTMKMKYNSINVAVTANTTFNSVTLAGIILCSIFMGLGLICSVLKNRESLKGMKNLVPKVLGLASAVFAVIVVSFATSALYTYTTDNGSNVVTLQTTPQYLLLEWASKLQHGVSYPETGLLVTWLQDEINIATYAEMIVVTVLQLAFIALAVASIIKQVSNLANGKNKTPWGVNIALLVVSVVYLSLAVVTANETLNTIIKPTVTMDSSGIYVPDYSYPSYDNTTTTITNTLTVVPAIITFVFSFLTFASSIAGKVVPLFLPKVENKTVENNG